MSELNPESANNVLLQEGIVSSGNSLDFTKEDMERMEQHGVAVSSGFRDQL